MVSNGHAVFIFCQALEQEMKARFSHCEAVCSSGEQLIQNNHYARRDIQARINSLRDKWQKLLDLSSKRRVRLDDAYESHQVTLFTVYTVLKCTEITKYSALMSFYISCINRKICYLTSDVHPAKTHLLRSLGQWKARPFNFHRVCCFFVSVPQHIMLLPFLRVNRWT